MTSSSLLHFRNSFTAIPILARSKDPAGKKSFCYDRVSLNDKCFVSCSPCAGEDLEINFQTLQRFKQVQRLSLVILERKQQKNLSKCSFMGPRFYYSFGIFTKSRQYLPFRLLSFCLTSYESSTLHLAHSFCNCFVLFLHFIDFIEKNCVKKDARRKILSSGFSWWLFLIQRALREIFVLFIFCCQNS